MVLINQKFTDEIEALNAIYGQGTLCPLRMKADGLEMRFHLPAVLPKDQITFHLKFPFSYPDSRAPTYLHADIDLFESLDRRIQNISFTVLIFLEKVFVAGGVCVFDLIDAVLAMLSCMEEHTVNLEKVEQFGPLLSGLEWRSMNKRFINMNDCLEKGECYICCHEDYSFRMVQVACKHFYCFTCFQMGWDIAISDGEVYVCCNQRIPVDTVRFCTNASRERCREYERDLLERDTINPFFCGNPHCNALIGSMSLWDLSRGRARTRGVLCPTCKMHTCAGCRTPKHLGICLDQKELVELFKRADIRRCPKCGDAIEKNGGCSHIQCRTCKSHFTWEKNGTLGKHLGLIYELNGG